MGHGVVSGLGKCVCHNGVQDSQKVLVINLSRKFSGLAEGDDSLVVAWRRADFALTERPLNVVVSICLMAARALSGRESMYDSMSASV